MNIAWRISTFLCALVGSRNLSTTNTVSWQELWIDQSILQPQPSPSHKDSSSVGTRIKQGESIVKLQDIVSSKECDFLAASCLKTAQEQTTSVVLDKPGLVRLPTVAAYNRAQKTKTPCAEPLPKEIDELLQDVLQRIVNTIDEQIPSIVATLFHNVPLAEQILEFKFSSREPAINVYSKGGEFLAHKDAQALTVLVPLSYDFEGGGTAFWSQDSRGHRVEEPSLIVKPRAGTAMLFGGRVTHAGIPVIEGTRVVFVASFSPNDYRVKEEQRDIYGDSM